MQRYQWDSVDKEQLNPTLVRQAIHGQRITIARIFLSQGARVPEHAHASEQISMVERGKLRFHIAGQELVAEAGTVVQIPPDAPHWVEAIEESLAVDIFSPVREDWRSGDDAYLRKSA
jgi:quercetin dioxygenase-like cupin family protein